MIPISSFPLDLQAELQLLRNSQNGMVSMVDVEHAFRVLLNERRGRIAVKSLDKSVQKALDQYEPDNQGYLKFSDIEDALLAQMSAKKRSRISTIASVFIALVLIVFLGGVFGLVFLVVDINKDMRSMKGQLIDRSTGLPVQTASSDTTLVNGALVSRSSADSAKRRGLTGSDASLDVVSTVQYTQQASISSTMTNSQLANVMSVSKTFGSTQYHLNLQVLGFWTVPKDGQAGQKSVIFLTQAGPYWLNGTELAEANPSTLNGLFNKAKAAASQGTWHVNLEVCPALATDVVCSSQVADSRWWAQLALAVGPALCRTAVRPTSARLERVSVFMAVEIRPSTCHTRCSLRLCPQKRSLFADLVINI